MFYPYRWVVYTATLLTATSFQIVHSAANPDIDTDGDGIPDLYDNCPEISNPLQLDFDADWVGDDCEIIDEDDSNRGGNVDEPDDGDSGDEQLVDEPSVDEPSVDEPSDDADPIVEEQTPTLISQVGSWVAETPATWLQNYSNSVGQYLEVQQDTKGIVSVRYDGALANLSAPAKRVLSFELLPKYGDLNTFILAFSSTEVTGGWRYTSPKPVAAGHWETVNILFDPLWSDDDATLAGWSRWGGAISFAEMMTSVANFRLVTVNPVESPMVLGIRDLTFAANLGTGDTESLHWVFPARWQPLSLPCLPPIASRSIAKVLGDDITGSYGEDWTVYRIDDESGQYIKQSYHQQMALSQVYWLLNMAQAPQLLDVPLNCAIQARGTVQRRLSINADRAASIAVGNPYGESLPLSELQLNTVQGACNGEIGCSWREAASNAYVAPKLFQWSAPSQGYVVVDEDDNEIVAPWGSWQGVVLPALYGLGASLGDAPSLAQ